MCTLNYLSGTKFVADIVNRQRFNLKYASFWGVAKLVRHKVLILACVGSSPATPAIFPESVT